MTKLLPLLAVLTPVLIAAIKSLLPEIPKKYIPLLAPLLGAVAEVIYQVSSGPNPSLPPGILLVTASAGVAVREVVDQWKRDGIDQWRGACTLLFSLGLAGNLAACNSMKQMTPQEKVITACTVAAETYDPVQRAIEQSLASPVLAGDGKKQVRDILRATDKDATQAIVDCESAAEIGNADGMTLAVRAIASGTSTALAILVQIQTISAPAPQPQPATGAIQ